MQAHVFFHQNIAYVLIFLAIAMAAMLLWFIIDWRKRKDDPVDQKQAGKNFKVEPAWIVVPFLAVMIVISWGCRDYTTNWHAMMMRGHAMMDGNAANNQEYDKLIEDEKRGVSIPPVELGKQIYSYYGCNACHSLDGRAMTGPSWKGLFGSTRVFSDNSEVVADENYIRTSIVSPSSQVVKGYGNVMPSFSYLSDKQIEGVIAYIKTLK